MKQSIWLGLGWGAGVRGEEKGARAADQCARMADVCNWHTRQSYERSVLLDDCYQPHIAAQVAPLDCAIFATEGCFSNSGAARGGQRENKGCIYMQSCIHHACVSARIRFASSKQAPATSAAGMHLKKTGFVDILPKLLLCCVFQRKPGRALAATTHAERTQEHKTQSQQ